MRGVMVALVVCAAGCGRLGFSWSDDTAPPTDASSIDTSPDVGVSSVGLAGWWKLDDGSGQVAIDSSGLGHPGVLVNNPSWGVGRIGGALDMDGTNRYAQVATPGLLGNGEATIAAWIWPRSVPGTTFVIFTDGYDGMYCGFDFASQLTCTNDSGVTNPMSDPMSVGAWHHIAGVRASDGTHTFYVDGVVSGAPSQGAGPIGTGTFNGAIGARWDAAGAFDGLIDDVRIYTRALTPAEIALLAQ